MNLGKYSNDQIEKMEKNELEKILIELEDTDRKGICPNHPLEVVFMNYYLQIHTDKIEKEKKHVLCRMLAKIYQEEDNSILSATYYQKSLEYNPVDLDTLFSYAEFLHEIGDYTSYRVQLLSTFPFIFTRNDMARFYRLLGVYYITIYKPQVAKDLNDYSLIFSASEMAEGEIAYLREALGAKLADHSIETIIENLKAEDIPIEPNSRTLALLYRVALDCIQAKNVIYARQLLTCLFTFTQDEEIAKKLADLNSTSPNE